MKLIIKDNKMDVKIKSITIVSNCGVRRRTVGQDGVVKIICNNIEYENSIDFVYDVVGKNNKLLHQIINCPVDVEYFK